MNARLQQLQLMKQALYKRIEEIEDEIERINVEIDEHEKEGLLLTAK